MTSISAWWPFMVAASLRVGTVMQAQSPVASSNAWARAETVTVPLHLVNDGLFVSATVDGHTGVWLLDSGGPMILINREYLQPGANGHGIDTVTGSYHEDSIAARGQIHVDTTWMADSAMVQFGALQIPIRSRHGVVVAAPLPKRLEQLWRVKPLGILGFPMVLRGYETVVDYARGQLTLIPVDSAGHRLVAVPRYTLATTVPFIAHATEGGWFVTAQLGGRLDTLLVDTGESFNKLNSATPARLATHLTATGRTVFDDLMDEPVMTVDQVTFAGRSVPTVPFSVSALRMDGFGNAFFRQFGAVGFNWRAGQLVLYR